MDLTGGMSRSLHVVLCWAQAVEYDVLPRVAHLGGEQGGCGSMERMAKTPGVKIPNASSCPSPVCSSPDGGGDGRERERELGEAAGVRFDGCAPTSQKVHLRIISCRYRCRRVKITNTGTNTCFSSACWPRTSSSPRAGLSFRYLEPPNRPQNQNASTSQHPARTGTAQEHATRRV